MQGLVVTVVKPALSGVGFGSLCQKPLQPSSTETSGSRVGGGGGELGLCCSGERRPQSLGAEGFEGLLFEGCSPPHPSLGALFIVSAIAVSAQLVAAPARGAHKAVHLHWPPGGDRARERPPAPPAPPAARLRKQHEGRGVSPLTPPPGVHPSPCFFL